MIAMFPFDLPGHNALYAILYVVTWSVHAMFASYVLAGAAYIATVDILGRDRTQAIELTVAAVLRDWLPFALGVAITAGVAPLLFVQILHKKAFYTANLLLFHRWMALLPILILGFYLLYAIKTRWYANKPQRRWWVSLPALACMVFTAYSWTENHLLSLQSQQQWSDFYGDHQRAYWNPAVIVRMLMWASGAMSVMLLLVGWQLRGAANRSEIIAPLTSKRVSRLALGSIGVCAVATATYCIVDRNWRDQIAGASVVYFALIVATGMVQVVCWIRTRRAGRFLRAELLVASCAGCVALLSFSAIRESVRIEVSPEEWVEQSRQAARNGGLMTFLFCAAINATVVIFLVRGIRIGLRSQSKTNSDPVV